MPEELELWDELEEDELEDDELDDEELEDEDCEDQELELPWLWLKNLDMICL